MRKRFHFRLLVYERGAILVKISILKGKGLNLPVEPPRKNIYWVAQPGRPVKHPGRQSLVHKNPHIWINDISRDQNFKRTSLKHKSFIPYALLSLTGSSGEFLIPGLLRLAIEGPGLPGLSLNMSSRNSMGGGTDGTANVCLNTPRNWLRKQQYQINTYNAWRLKRKEKIF